MDESNKDLTVRNPNTDRRGEGELIDERGDARRSVAQLLASTGHMRASDAVLPEKDDGNTGDGDGWDVERLAAAIATKAARFLPDATLDPDQDFFEKGGTSVDAVELVAVLARELDIRLDFDDMFADARPRRLAQRWFGTNGNVVDVSQPDRPMPTKTTNEDLELIMADLARIDDLPWVDSPLSLAPGKILLTGATGFLGSHLLVDLLRRSDTHVVCLVRADDEQHGIERLGKALTSFDLPWSPELLRRVTVLPGDLGQSRLGLTEDRWQTLAAEVDSIVSVAAAVDFLRGYPSLRKSNVLGPMTLAQLAATGQVKPLHHISSVAVFNEVGISSMGEDDPVAHINRLVAGYDKSKWAAEAALRRARDHGLVVTLLRPGGIGGHTQTGAYNPHDLSSGFLSAFTRFRTLPAFNFLNVAPVDWVSQVAAAIICEPSGWGYNYNLAGRPNALSEVVRDMSLSGMNVRVLGWDEWRADVISRLQAEQIPELSFLARVLRSPTATKLCEATLLGPAVNGERTDTFVSRHNLPSATRYDAQAQQRTYERMVRDGLAQLPSREDPPYLWFPETMEGSLGPVDGSADSQCTMLLRLSIASMYQLVAERRVDIQGEVVCERIHTDPLVVEEGDMWVRPQDGIPCRHGLNHQLLKYRLRLRDQDGQAWWLEGQKTARPRRDLWRQTRALSIDVGREGEPAGLTGEVVVPANSYLRDQVDGIQVNPKLSSKEQRAAKLIWLAWFGAQVGNALLEPIMRAGAELLDLRRGSKEEFQ